MCSHAFQFLSTFPSIDQEKIILQETAPSSFFSFFLSFFFIRDMSKLSRTSSSSKTTTLLLFLFLLMSALLVSFCAVVCYFYACTANPSRLNWPGFLGSAFLVSGVLLLSTLLVVAARATVLTWITVLVLLAFSGKRRRVLVQQGRKITADVVMYLIRGAA